MSVLIAILVGVVCLAAGFVGGKLYTEKNLDRADLEKQIADSKQRMESYKEDVSANLAVTQKLMADMKTNYDSIVEQMANTTRLLEKPRIVTEKVPYFDDVTTQLMAANANQSDSRRKPESLASQPSDYSDGSSGLFSHGTVEKKAETEQV
jgi:uncharacterized membrane-anchored protein YhcB (DUF1043 family)